MREECNLAFPAGTDEPIGTLVIEPTYINHFLLDIQCLLNCFVV